MTPAGRRAVVAALAACCSQGAGGPAHGEILVALAAPQAGPMKPLGDAVLAAGELAVATINAAGGLAGQKLQAIQLNDECAAPSAEAVARAAVERGVAVVVGHPCAGAAVAAGSIYDDAPLLFLAAAVRHPDLAPGNSGTRFRVSGRDDRQGADIAGWVLERYRGKPIAIVHDRTQYARTIGEAAAAALGEAGEARVTVDTIVAAEPQYADLITRLARLDAAVVVFAGFPAEAAIILKGLRAAGSRAQFVAANAMATGELGERAGELAKGVIAFRPAPLEQPRAGLSHAALSIDAGRATFSGLMAWAAAARACGCLDAPSVARQLRTPGVPPPAGLAFDETGDAVVSSFEAVSWNGSSWISEAARSDQRHQGLEENATR